MINLIVYKYFEFFYKYLDECSLFQDSSATVAADDLSKINTDVDLAISSFIKTGKVPASVMEASIFRKPYFLNR
jgi:Fanconi anemia group A protein